jgi:hypothetical protein
MRIADLKNLQDDTDWVLSPTLLGLIIGVLGAVATISTSAPNILNQSSNTQSTGSELATGINDSDFNKALPHILKWEGTCSNHWADNGGKTFMGITKEVARKHGHADPCKMTKEQVYQVYYKDYWSRVPGYLNYPEKLVYFNLIINGSKSRCLSAGNASAMLDCQEQHYRNQRFDFKVFGDGWLNRNKYFKSLVTK